MTQGEKMKEIYFDNASTSFPKAPGVGEEMCRYINRGAYNINRGAYGGAFDVGEAVVETRELVRELFCASPDTNIVFTPGVTQSMNLLIDSVCKKGDHVLVSGLEHNAVMRPLWRKMKSGTEVEMIPVDEDGAMDVDRFSAMLRPDTKLVIMTHASNVCGSVLPVEKMGNILAGHPAFFALDAAQSGGSIKINMKDMNIDFVGFAGHKNMLGPQGIGGFAAGERIGKVLSPLVYGGTGSRSDSFDMPDTWPDRFESGTMNLPGIIGLKTALEYIKQVGAENIENKKMRLTDRFIEQAEQIDGLKVIGPGTSKRFSRTSVVSVCSEKYDQSELAFLLSFHYGIMTRVGLHCAPLAHKSLGTFPAGTVRFSFGHANTGEEVDYCIETLRKLHDM